MARRDSWPQRTERTKEAPTAQSTCRRDDRPRHHGSRSERAAASDLEAAGERVDERLGRRAARTLEQGGLTRRELEILRLVAVGRTNREIAHQLFLSPRKVDMHVRNTLAKLGCRSRTEATGRAHELGLLEPIPSRL